MGSLESCTLPKQVIGVWQIIDVIGQVSRKLVELDVVVSEQHRLGALAAHIVPLAARIGDNTIGMPGPIALNDRIGRSHAALRSPAVHDRVPVAGVIHIHVISQADLMLVAGAIGPPGLGLRARQRRQEHRRQDRDDCDHHQQFDQRETAATDSARSIHRPMPEYRRLLVDTVH